VLDHEKSKDELIAELISLRQRLKDCQSWTEATDSLEYKRSKEDADFYLTILDEAPALIWRAAKDAKCDWFNATWLAFTGRELTQEIGDGWAEGVHPEDFDRCLETYLGAFNARKFFEMEYRLRRHDGEYRWILDIGCPFKDPGGDFAGYIGYCFDVTERKNNEQFRAEVERIIRHDIKTPLSGLHGLAQLAFKDGFDEEMRPLMPGLMRAIRHVINLVDSSEKFVLLEQGKYTPKSSWFCLETVVDDVKRTLQSVIDKKKVNVHLNIEVSCNCSGGVNCYGEEPLVYDMILNVVKNAVEASAVGSDVCLTCIEGEKELRLSVHNNGAVPENIRDSFFEKYVTSGKAQGTGLGTYSAQLVAKAHGGLMEFTSSEELGTVVTMVLPYPAAPAGNA